MNRKKFILGLLIAMVIALGSAFLTNVQPSVFAAEMPEQEIETTTNEAGTFYGQGYYEVGSMATLRAQMNDGYEFDAWVSVDDSGNVLQTLSNEEEYTFVVASNIKIQPTYHRIEYSVTFADNLFDDGKTELKDFTYQITNTTDGSVPYYYDNQLEIVINIKDDLYIYDLSNKNITINGVSIYDIIRTENPMLISCEILNDSKIGFSQATILLNIREDIIINIDYEYMYELEIVSGNENIDVSEIIQFITLTNYYSQPNNDECIYLIRASKQVSVTTQQGNDVYQFVMSQFQGQDPNIIYSQSYSLSENSTLIVTYNKKGYSISFNSYLINIYGEKDLMLTPVYSIRSVGVQAGDGVNFVYDEVTRIITITDIKDNIINTYEHVTDIFGYEFVGFAINNEIIEGSTYTLSETTPSDIEIQLLFKYIEYSFEIRLVDNYFADDATYSFKYDNEQNKLIAGTFITVQASTSKYNIVGWSWVATPITEDYVDVAENGSSDEYIFAFEPTSDDATQVYILYLDVDYKYSSITYGLKSNSVVKNMNYNVVSVDMVNNKITFSDSENINTAQEIIYTSSDVTNENGITIINTNTFGAIEIEGDVLSYTINSIKFSSVSKDTDAGVDTYTFNKYTYFGELQVSLIESISISEDGENVTVVFNGITYNNHEQTRGEIQRVVTTKTYNDAIGAYIIDYYYSMNLYMDGTEYSCITLRDVKYYYDGEKFVLNNATINTPAPVESVVTRSNIYNIQLSNLLPNAVLMYSTKTTNEINYSFTTFTNQAGSGLWNFVYNNYNSCVLNVTSSSVINVEYRQLANNITLVINNESAYNYENIVFTVQSSDGTTNGVGNTISAKDNDIITITINQNAIAKGYKFDNYIFDGAIVTNNANPLVFTLIMDSLAHANKIINIEFSAINYTININYIDSEGNIIRAEDANGGVRLQGQAEFITTLQVNLNGEYTFEAVANEGFYVGNAYMGSNAFTLSGMIGNNASKNLITAWQLNGTNFEQAVIDIAGESTVVNMYINFAIHTYSVKVYFEIGSNASAIIYPKLHINNVEQTLIVAQEEDNGIMTTKRYILSQGYEYNTNALLKVDNFMLGTTILQWTDSKGQQIATSTEYSLNQIKQDTILKVVLQYVSYPLQFVILDEQGQECSYGSVSTNNRIVKLFDTIYYTVNTEIGYVLKQKYYYSAPDVLGTGKIDSGFEFNPANFSSATPRIYLVFGLKSVNLSIGNNLEGNKYYFKKYEASDLASYTVSRKRGNTISELTDATGYEFQTGDILTMQINPISMGIELSKVQLGSTNITLSSASPYKLSMVDTKEDGKLIGMYYVLEIEFAAGIISSMEDNVALLNIIAVKTFNITYTYNYIDYKFGIRLIRQYGGSTATGNEDVSMMVNDVGYGTDVAFSYAYEGMASGDGSKFNVDGFTIAGIKQGVTDIFRFNDIGLWEQVALNKYSENNNNIEVILILKPKIILNNYTEYSGENGYTYQRTYIGAAQGLINSGANPDVVVGGDFSTIIQYSYDAGISYTDYQPINVGEYMVKIIAQITSDQSPVTNVVFEEKVTYVIVQATLTISLETYNNNNPITKTYDGTNNLSSRVIADDIVFNGLYEIDKNNVFVDQSRLRAQFANIIVNSASSLYDVSVFDIYLLDGSNNEVKNYKLASGQNLIFTKIGKINPKELRITGFNPSNKVYDATNTVKVNTDSINYVGKLASDSTQILNENLKFYVEDISIGKNREVFIDWSTALVGADSINYSITYDKTYIDIHPYEITYYLKDYGTFKIVDVDRLCLIPIGSRMFARAYDKGSNEYRGIYTIIEPQIVQGEKLKACYEVIMQVSSVNQLVPQGLYIYIPKVGKVSKVMQLPNEKQSQQVEHATQNEYTIIKVKKGEAVFGVVVNTTYLPLWMIVLIVMGSALVIGAVVAVFIIIRRKAKQKYSAYDRI